MANGDIVYIKELGRYSIPGSGHNTVGIAKNNKITAWGQLKASYVSTGIALNKAGGIRALGVDVPDHVSFQVVSAGASSAVLPASDTQFLANLEVDKIFLCDQIGQANPAVPSAGDIIIINYLVIGEDARTPDLT